MALREIKPGIYAVGSQDWNRKYFDNLVPLPDGTSYNAYLVKGSEKTALIDSVYPPKEQELLDVLKDNDIKKIDYIVSNHAEQDHSGSIKDLLALYPEAMVVTNQKCKELLWELHEMPSEKVIQIADNEELSLGDKTLKFVMAPWVHWPDTQFTYVVEDKILFTCDLFGSHIASTELFVVDECKILEEAKRYYAEIMMPFAVNVRKHIERIKTMDVEMIAPSHGPIYKKPQMIMDEYSKWASETPQNIVVIPYISMYDSTTKMALYLTELLVKKGIDVQLFDLSDYDAGKLAMSLIDAATIVVGASMVLMNPHPKAVEAVFFANLIRPKAKYVSVIGSYGWADAMAPKMAKALVDFMPNVKAEVLEPVIAKGLPKAQDYKNLDILAASIVEKHAGLMSAS